MSGRLHDKRVSHNTRGMEMLVHSGSTSRMVDPEFFPSLERYTQDIAPLDLP